MWVCIPSCSANVLEVEGRVLAVEASPANAGLLRKHLDWNDCRNVRLVEAAIGDREGEWYSHFVPTRRSRSGLPIRSPTISSGETATVRMTTIDTLCTGCDPDLIKIDIEGAEFLALKGRVQNPYAVGPDTRRRNSPSGHAGHRDRSRRTCRVSWMLRL